MGALALVRLTAGLLLALGPSSSPSSCSRARADYSKAGCASSPAPPWARLAPPSCSASSSRCSSPGWRPAHPALCRPADTRRAGRIVRRHLAVRPGAARHFYAVGAGRVRLPAAAGWRAAPAQLGAALRGERRASPASARGGAARPRAARAPPRWPTRSPPASAARPRRAAPAGARRRRRAGSGRGPGPRRSRPPPRRRSARASAAAPRPASRHARADGTLRR